MQANAGSDVKPKLSLGPILFHWPAERKRDFYLEIADEAAVDTVYLGEVICSKRAPFFERYYAEVAERLVAAGKTVVFSSLAEVMTAREREMTSGLAEIDVQTGMEVEANDTAALYHLRNKPHRVGPFINVYNEKTMAFLAAKGATHFCLPTELPAQVLAGLCQAAGELGVTLETQVYGRVGLALSARCYHARAHNRVKDNCQYVCEQDPDGMTISTLDKLPFLAINGVQTLSYTYVNLLNELAALKEMGINTFRLSPHSHNMCETLKAFRGVLDGELAPREALARTASQDAPFANGFYHGVEGHHWVDTIKLVETVDTHLV